MKKLLISFILIFVILCAAPAALADDTPVELGSVAAGTELRFQIAELPVEGAVIESSSLPAGCYLQQENNRVILCGVPSIAGPCSFDISIPGVYYSKFNMTVLPATPVLQTTTQLTGTPGGSTNLYVDSYIADSGTLSYQWYTVGAPASTGGTPVSGGNTSWLTVSTPAAGSYYYYCVVTNSNNGYTASAATSPITVTVKSNTPTSLTITSLPAKTEYKVGEMLDPAGLTLTVNYPDRVEQLSSDYQLSPTEFNTVGAQTITVSCNGVSSTFTVNVISDTDNKVEILSLPTKLTYKIGDWLDTKGMKLLVTQSGKTKEVSTGFTCTPSTLSLAGAQEITVRYGELSCTYTVQVSEGKREISLSVKTMPKKTNYNVGETLDSSGLVLTLTTDSGTEVINSGFTCSPSVLSIKGRQVVEVRYHELTCNFVVNVAERPTQTSPSPSPSPSASPAVSPSPSPSASPEASPQVSPQVTPTPRPSREPTEKKSSAGAVIVLVVSIAALTGLTGYVLVMNNGGVDGLIEVIKDRFKRH